MVASEHEESIWVEDLQGPQVEDALPSLIKEIRIIHFLILTRCIKTHLNVTGSFRYTCFGLDASFQ